MPIYKYKKGKWRVRLYDNDGHQREWKLKGSKADAKGFEARKSLELEANAPIATARSVPRFGDFCVNQYRPSAELHLGDTTWYQRSFIVEALGAYFGDLKLTEFREEHIDRYIRHRRADIGPREIDYARKLKDGREIRVKYLQESRDEVGDTAINNELRVLRRILNFARERRVPVADLKIKLLDQVRKRVHFWTAGEVAKLLEVCIQIEPELLPLLVFLLNTGCRPAEGLNAEWNNIDLERMQVRIHPSECWRPKTNEPREIPISGDLLPWLKARRDHPRWLFPNRLGQQFESFPKRIFRRVVQAAGLKGGPYACRHTFASQFLLAVPDIDLLAKVLGHTQVSTSRLYAHMLPDRLAKAINAVSFGASIGPAQLQAQITWARRKENAA